MKISNLMMLLVAILVMSSCGKNGDKEIEKQVVGTWTAAHSEEEDGMEVYITSEATYNDDNSFKQSYVINYPDMGYGCSIFVTCEGKWHATKDMIYEEVDENSIKMEFSEDFLYLAEISESEAKKEFLSDMKSDDLKTEGKIISLGKDEITLSEDGIEYTMYRK